MRSILGQLGLGGVNGIQIRLLLPALSFSALVPVATTFLTLLGRSEALSIAFLVFALVVEGDGFSS